MKTCHVASNSQPCLHGLKVERTIGVTPADADAVQFLPPITAGEDKDAFIAALETSVEDKTADNWSQRPRASGDTRCPR